MCPSINPSKACGYNSENKQVLVAKWVVEAWQIKTIKKMFICAFKKCDTITGEGGPENHLVYFEGIDYVMPQPDEEFPSETSNG